MLGWAAEGGHVAGDESCLQRKKTESDFVKFPVRFARHLLSQECEYTII